MCETSPSVGRKTSPSFGRLKAPSNISSVVSPRPGLVSFSFLLPAYPSTILPCKILKQDIKTGGTHNKVYSSTYSVIYHTLKLVNAKQIKKNKSSDIPAYRNTHFLQKCKCSHDNIPRPLCYLRLCIRVLIYSHPCLDRGRHIQVLQRL